MAIVSNLGLSNYTLTNMQSVQAANEVEEEETVVEETETSAETEDETDTAETTSGNTGAEIAANYARYRVISAATVTNTSAAGSTSAATSSNTTEDSTSVTAEDAVEDEVEEAVEETVEDAVEDAAEDESGITTAKISFWRKLLNTVGLIINPLATIFSMIIEYIGDLLERAQEE